MFVVKKWMDAINFIALLNVFSKQSKDSIQLKEEMLLTILNR